MKLFLISFLQVLCITINSYLVLKETVFGVMVMSFLISVIYSFNVKKMVYGSTKEKLIWAFGASVGAGVGMQLSKIISKNYCLLIDFYFWL